MIVLHTAEGVVAVWVRDIMRVSRMSGEQATIALMRASDGTPGHPLSVTETPAETW